MDPEHGAAEVSLQRLGRCLSWGPTVLGAHTPSACHRGSQHIPLCGVRKAAACTQLPLHLLQALEALSCFLCAVRTSWKGRTRCVLWLGVLHEACSVASR